MGRPPDCEPVYSIEFAHPLRDTLMARVTGASSFEATQGYWQAVVRVVQEREPCFVMLVDELRGPPLSAAEWQALVASLCGQGLEGVRIAHVKPFGLDASEYCEIYALEAGFDARVFVDARTAELWLRYGAPGASHELTERQAPP
jgi:hypothetical protein